MKTTDDEGEDLGIFDREALLMRLPPDARIVTREQVETVARILGEGSISAQALARADKYGAPVRFWYSSESSMLWLELIEDRLN
jgi:hypothetical protein